MPTTRVLKVKPLERPDDETIALKMYTHIHML